MYLHDVNEFPRKCEYDW